MTDQKPRVLIIDDEPTICRSLSLLLKDTYDVETAECGEAALEILEKRSPPDIVLLDVMMPGADGLSILKRLKETDAKIPVIMLTGASNVKGAVEAIKLGVLLIRDLTALLSSRAKPPRKTPILARWLESPLEWLECSLRSKRLLLAIALF